MLVLNRLEGGPKRVNHAAVEVNGIIYSFGGFDNQVGYSVDRPIDVYALNTVTLRWKELEYSDNGRSSNIPFRRYGHTVVAQGDIIYLWGGRREEYSCNRLFLFDTLTKKWSAPSVPEPRPEPRDGHAACIASNCMFIFGGFEDEAEDFSGDVWGLDLKTLTWSCLYKLQSTMLKRDFLSSVVIGDKIYLFGGRAYSYPEYDNDILTLDLNTMSWSQPVINGFKPVGRRSHSAVAVGDKMIVFGGYNDTTNEHFNDFLMFDPAVNKWTSLTVLGGPLPCPRRRQCCVVVGTFLYIFGGSCPIPETQRIRPLDLMELSDLFIVDTAMSLRSLALRVTIHFNLQTKVLPPSLAKEIENLKADNEICNELRKLELANSPQWPD